MNSEHRPRLARPITHRDIPIQVGLTFQTFDEMVMNNGAIEETQTPMEYFSNAPVDNMEWRLLDQNSPRLGRS